MPRTRLSGGVLVALGLGLLAIAAAPLLVSAQSTSAVFDPGVRGGPAGAGGPLPGLTPSEATFFTASRTTFQEVDSVSVTNPLPGTGGGLGPRFNMDTCAGCHAQPDVGGTSPFTNPQIAVAHKAGASNPEDLSAIISLSGPVREVRFKVKPDGATDGGVHDLFTITGRSDAASCSISQPDFNTAMKNGNAIFRIPTPTFGGGLIEAIDDSTIIANKNANGLAKFAFGISGRANREGNSGTITRFGWKAQNKSLELFAGEAYNVEQGVTNEIFQNERDETPGCQLNGIPEDHTNFDATAPTDVPSDLVKFATFMRFTAPPQRQQVDTSTPAGVALANTIAHGYQEFRTVGCALCHTPSLKVSPSSSAAITAQQTANLFSDLLVHAMGTNLADGISQGNASGNEFRTAPLWGLGQRIFFLHDGRTTDLVQAIQAHASPGSEANTSIAGFNALADSDKQSILYFLRSL
jgi:CxxC motif-containing protein (DUF1111 family)